MVRNADWKDTYCTPEVGNVRYPSSVAEAVGGWAYVYTADDDYPAHLAFHGPAVQVRYKNRWLPYQGVLPTHDEAFDDSSGGPPEFEPDEAPDPNY